MGAAEFSGSITKHSVFLRSGQGLVLETFFLVRLAFSQDYLCKSCYN